MKIKFLVVFLLISSVVVSQEIGRVNEGSDFIKLLKTDNLYSLIYSDINFEKLHAENSFHFTNKEKVYLILMNGFNKERNHQIILQTNNDTIVKFNFKKIKGELMVFVYQNNLKLNTFGMSTFFSKKQIDRLFSAI